MRNYSFSLSLSFSSLRDGETARVSSYFSQFLSLLALDTKIRKRRNGGELDNALRDPVSSSRYSTCQLYVPFFSVYLKAHDEIYRAGNSPCSFFSFFFSLANILENSLETRLGGWRWMGRAGMGEKLGRGREKNFLIGRIVEQPSAQSYNFSIVSKLPDSFPRHSARARISDSKRTRDTGAIGIPLLRPVSS